MYEAFLFHSMPFPSLFYYWHCLNVKGTIIEGYENYQKKGLRNKYYIHHSNGIQALTIPLEKGKNNQCKIKEVKISYDEDWQYFHLKSLKTAYNRSPFFEYYIEELSLLYKDKPRFLWDFNSKTTEVITEILDIETIATVTKKFVKLPSNTRDYRKSWSDANNVTLNQSYSHVFEYKNLDLIKPTSILDIIFSKGPETSEILKQIKLN